MSAYRRKLEVIDAIQFTDAASANAITEWSKGLVVAPPVLAPTDENPSGLYMEYGGETILPNNWLIRRGLQFEIVDPAIFENTYVEGDAQNDLPKTVTNPLGIERRKVDTGAPERRGLSGRAKEALRLEVTRLTTENIRLTRLVNRAVTGIQVLKDGLS